MTDKPMTAEEIAEIFCREWCKDWQNSSIDLTQALTDFGNQRYLEGFRKGLYEDTSRNMENHRMISREARKAALEEAADFLIFKPGEDRLTFDPACIEELKQQPEVAMRKLLAGFAEEIRSLIDKKEGV